MLQKQSYQTTHCISALTTFAELFDISLAHAAETKVTVLRSSDGSSSKGKEKSFGLRDTNNLQIHQWT